MRVSSVDDLLRKYDIPVPRYTSYPTVPFWDTSSFNLTDWEKAVKRSFQETNRSKGISLYLHLPFCESLCTYCACNTRITKNHAVELPYLEAILKEWTQYLGLFNEKPIIREIHLGGGTPTFFSPENLQRLIGSILDTAIRHDSHEFSIEGHPNNTSESHLRVLSELGFRRVSYGVQDLDERVQRAIHRIQPFENLERATRISRALNYDSISYDLVYGLPFQTVESVTRTVEQLIALRPERIAFYSYAHVPWLKPGQRGYEDADLPGDVEKRKLYEAGRDLFRNAGYLDIGMDHFALPEDSLAIAFNEEKLHRNFMGYTTTNTELLIGLGASAISDAGYAYAQNEKKVEAYQNLITSGQFPVVKGHLMSENDRAVRSHILKIACTGKLDLRALSAHTESFTREEIIEMEADGLIEIGSSGLQVTEVGRMFIRPICSSFDAYLHIQKSTQENIFSKAI